MGKSNVMQLPVLAALAFSLSAVTSKAADLAPGPSAGTSHISTAISRPSPFTGSSILLRADSSFRERVDAEYAAETSLWLAPAYRFNENLTLGALFIVTRELTDEQKMKTSDLLLSLRHRGTQLNKTFRLSPSVTFKAPTSKVSFKDEGLYLGIKAGPRLYFDLGKLTGFHDLGVYQNFHKYRTSLSEKSNSRNTLINWTNLNYALSQKFAIDFTMQYISAWTYGGNMKSSFEFETAVEFNASKRTVISLGVTNGGGLYKADGVSSNLALYDPLNSTFFSSLTVKL